MWHKCSKESGEEHSELKEEESEGGPIEIKSKTRGSVKMKVAANDIESNIKKLEELAAMESSND